MNRAHALVMVAWLAAARDGRADGEPPVDRDRLRQAAAEGAGLEAALVGPDRGARLAAIAAADAAPDAGGLLDELAVAAGGWDRSAAAPAARAARVIARRLVDGEVAGGRSDRPPPGEVPELDDDALAAAMAAWRAIALRGDRWADVRVHALEVVVALAAVRAQGEGALAPASAYDVVALAGDPDPEVRRAALELIAVPAPIDVRVALVERLVGDPVPAVRLAAAQALCAGLPRDAAAVLVALGPDGLQALRDVAAPDVAAGAVPGAAALDAARCLAADPAPPSRRTLEQLRHRAPRSLRATLAAIVADVTARSPPPPGARRP